MPDEKQDIPYERIHKKPEGPPSTEGLSRYEGYPYLFSESWLKEMGDRPLCLDIGAGMGRFLMEEAIKSPEKAFLGIDPDYQCVKRNLQKLKSREKQDIDMQHVRMFFGSVYHVLPLLPKKSVSIAYINYPDPWFKRRHLKRRLVKEELFASLKPILKDGASVYVQTDIADYASSIDEELKKVKGFEIQTEAHSLFEGFTTTLYQEKASAKNHSRFCYYLKNIES